MRLWICWREGGAILTDVKPHYDPTDGKTRYVGHPGLILELKPRLDGSLPRFLESFNIKHDGRAHAIELRRWPS